MACLVQQLFRQKIGKELDQGIIDEVLFPLLFKQKHGPKELLQDIKLTQSCNEHGLSAIVGRVGRLDRHKNISPFEEPLGPHSLSYVRADGPDQRLPGKVPSQMRRLRHMSMWGSIDILNELRSLKQPLFGQHRPTIAEDALDPWRPAAPGDEFGGIYILLEEVPPWSSRNGEAIRLSDLKFMNDYLDDSLNTGKCISWGGDNITTGRKILSTHY
jgi:hypothetical protein